MLEQPISARLGGSHHVLLAGCGGGYDVLGAVPLLIALRRAGIEVALASLSFTYLNGLEGAERDTETPNLYGVSAAAATERAYCPEAWLARFLDDRLGGNHTIWCFEKTGVRPLAAAYRTLVRRLGSDTILLIDGGIDALLRGDETSLGTPAEDLTSLAAVQTLDDVPQRLLAAVGLGAELRDGIQHAQVFERIAELTREGGFLGSSSMLASTTESLLYLDAVEYVFGHQAEQRQSHVHRVISAACRGEFGATAPHVWLSPLLSLYWFFDLGTLARTHLFLRDLLATETIWEVTARIEAIRKRLQVKDRTPIPL